MSDGILNGIDPATLAEHFGEVDLEYTWLQEPQTMTHSDEVAQLRAEIPKQTVTDFDAMSNSAIIENLERMATLFGGDRNPAVKKFVRAVINRLQHDHAALVAITESANLLQDRIAELERDTENQAKLLDALRETIGQMEHEAGTQYAAALDLQAQRDAVTRQLEFFRNQFPTAARNWDRTQGIVDPIEETQIAIDNGLIEL